MLDPTTGGVLAMASSARRRADGYREATADEQRIRADHRPVRARLDLQGRDRRRRPGREALRRRRRKSRCPAVFKLYEYPLVDADPDPGTKTVADILKVSSNVGTARLAYEYLSAAGATATTAGCCAKWIDRLGFGAGHRHRPAGRDAGAGAAVRQVVGHVDPEHPDRLRHGGHADPARVALRHDRQRRRLAVRPHLAARVGESPPIQPKAERLLPERVATQLTQMLRAWSGGRHGPPGRDPRLHASRARPAPRRRSTRRHLLRHALRRLVRRLRAGHDPRVVTLVMVDEPEGDSYYGGEVAAPAFAELTSRALLALGVQRDRSLDPAADAAREAATQTP